MYNIYIYICVFFKNGMKNLVDSLTASQARAPSDQHGPAATLSALSAASILPAGGMATIRVCKMSKGCGTARFDPFFPRNSWKLSLLLAGPVG